MGCVPMVTKPRCDGRDSWGLIEKHKGDRVRQLVIAGALIAAEIERQQRIES